jgi:hypothetical protein
MTKHCILNFNPQAEYEWDRCVLKNPLTGERLDLTEAIAEAIDRETGSYLISVDIEVRVLDKTAIPQTFHQTVELPAHKPVVRGKKLLASQSIG